MLLELAPCAVALTSCACTAPHGWHLRRRQRVRRCAHREAAALELPAGRRGPARPPEFHKGGESAGQAKIGAGPARGIQPEEKKAQAARKVAEQIRLYETQVAVPALLLMPDSKMMQARRRCARPRQAYALGAERKAVRNHPPRARALSLAALGCRDRVRALLHRVRDAVRGASNASAGRVTRALSPRADGLALSRLARAREEEQVALLETKFDALFYINRLIDLIFITDIGFNFFLASP